MIKTTDQDGRKVFINVCTSDRIPLPGCWKDGLLPEAVEAALAEAADESSEDSEALRFPVSIGSLRPDADKRGEACAVVDAVVNDGVVRTAGEHRPFKAFLIDLILGHVGEKHKLQLDPKYKLPKMAYKGAGPEPQRVRAERKPLVTEVAADAKQSKQQQQQQQQAGASSTAQPATRQLPGAAAAATAGVAGKAGGGQQKSSDGAAAGPLDYAIEYEGRPVAAVKVTVQLPGTAAVAAATAAEIRAEVSGCDVYVSVAGQDQLSVQLPFAVSPEGAEAKVLGAQGQQRVLQLRLPYQPLRQWVGEMVAAMPHSFGALPVSQDAYLELQ